jgi:hypothetical protein
MLASQRRAEDCLEMPVEVERPSQLVWALTREKAPSI